MIKVSLADRKKFASEEFITRYGEPGRPQTKVVDLQKVGEYILEKRKSLNQSTYIYLQPTKPDKYKDPEEAISYARDPQFDVNYGVVSHLYKDGSVRWKRFYIRETHVFNLANAADRELFVLLMMHSKTLGSPFQIEDAVRVLHDPESEAAEGLIKTEAIQFALAKIKEIPADEFVNFARSCGIPINDDTSYQIIFNQLNNKAIEEPDVINREFDNPSRLKKQSLLAAKDLGIVEITDKGWMFHGHELGMTEERAIDKLKGNSDLFANLLVELRENDIYTERVKSDVEKSHLSESIGTKKIIREETVTIDFGEETKSYTLKTLKDACDKIGLTYMPSIKLNRLSDKFTGFLGENPDKIDLLFEKEEQKEEE